ncbi:HEAT repeat domain-containing protein [Candidatus Cyanaurora vandensis]|uniref:HEAT repeat domain-containing protein n=1 Tax=Candidatus Cyanaurora vandensis TaxID=2714958 RepID=UPI00257FF885|nr:HEAT repeat domain-containing protein [Candidatus Cyanaurora vandensis]
MTLHEQLQDPDLGTRIRAINAIRALPATEAVPLLALALNDVNTRVRYSAASMLGTKSTPQSLQLLLTALQEDPEFDVRAAAAAALGDLKDPVAFPALIQAYQRDREEMVRFSIVAALGELGDPRGLELLTLALSQGGLQEEAALMALGQLALPEVIPYLTTYLTHPDWQLRLRAVQALGAMGTEASLAPLQELKDDNPTVQQALQITNPMP